MEKLTTPIFLIIIQVVFTLITAIFILSNFAVIKPVTSIAAVIAIILYLYLFVLSSKSVQANAIAKAYAIFISGTFLINFTLFFTCLDNISLNFH